MKNSLTLTLLVFATIANAQYKPTAVDGRRWNQHLHQVSPFFPGMHYNEFRGDTIYKNKTMLKLISVDSKGNFESLEAMVFEDIATPAITYYYPQSGLFGDSVHLNLALTSGDSIMVQCNGDTGYYRADSISFITDLQQTQRKQHHFSFKMPQYSFGSYRTYFNWIEGFGGIEGSIISPVPPTCFSDPPNFEVICVFDSTMQLYQNPDYSICDGVSLSETDYPQISLFPNPASTFVDIENSILTEVKTIQIVNSAGLLVKEISNPTTGRIDIRELPIGLYSINVTFLQNNVSIVKKFVVSR